MRLAGSSRRYSNISVVFLKGSEPTTRKGCRGRALVRKSLSTIRILGPPLKRFRRLQHKTGGGFDGHNMHAAPRKRRCHGARTGTDFDNQFARPEIGLFDQSVGSTAIEKVLTEKAPAPVPGGPPAGGH
jgi:hypothetical protein